jgi:uncharacterized membrane protein YfcA
MNIDPTQWVALVLFFFLIATLYSSVGFGGGSSYLALLSLMGFSFFFIRTNALLCNLIVVSGSSVLFYTNKLIHFKDIFPFVVASIPLTFLGSLLKLEETLFFILLALTLIGSSLSLFWQTFFLKNQNPQEKKIPLYLNYIIGGAIGFLSGLVGIGGGVFLAPLLLHLRWGKPIKIAALTAFFILVNSLSGLLGLVLNNTFDFSFSITLPLLIAVFIGGQLGVRISIRKGSSIWIKTLTGILVLSVGIRILITQGFAVFA